MEVFGEVAIAISVIAQYWYCPATIANRVLFGEIRLLRVIDGSRFHDEEIPLVPSLGFKGRMYIEYSH